MCEVTAQCVRIAVRNFANSVTSVTHLRAFHCTNFQQRRIPNVLKVLSLCCEISQIGTFPTRRDTAWAMPAIKLTKSRANAVSAEFVTGRERNSTLLRRLPLAQPSAAPCPWGSVRSDGKPKRRCWHFDCRRWACCRSGQLLSDRN